MQFLIEKITELNAALNSLIWGGPLVALIICVGVYFSVRTGFPQLVRFRYAMKNTVGKALSYGKTGDKGALSPFQAVTTALAGTVGTGNIAGVAGAIALGGPGAVFWMWVSAFFGMATKYAEILLAVKFRKRNPDGDWVGGPMYYITGGLGKEFRWLAVLFSVFGAVAAIGAGNMVQVNTAVCSLLALAEELSASAPVSAVNSGFALRLTAGLIISAIASLVLLGGMKRIGAVTEKVIPAMGVLYVAAALVVIAANIGRAACVLEMIIVGAFSPDAVLGGACGIGIMRSMRYGVGRGVFSNEAGLGSSPIAHAATSETDPVKQGLFGIFEVFADTFLICTLTALVILMSGVSIPFGENAGAALTISAFGTAFGGKAAGIFIAAETALFSVSTVLSWSLYGCRCAEYIFGARASVIYKLVYIIFITVGAVMQMGLAWSVAETMNGLMAIPNLLALIPLSSHVVKLTKEHFRK